MNTPLCCSSIAHGIRTNTLVSSLAYTSRDIVRTLRIADNRPGAACQNFPGDPRHIYEFRNAYLNDRALLLLLYDLLISITVIPDCRPSTLYPTLPTPYLPSTHAIYLLCLSELDV
jgi:hypothetical protein